MQQHRYWRILCVSNDANYNSFQAAEIQFRAAAGGPALTGTVTASTPNDANSTALKAIDGDPTTAYISSASTAFPHFFALDLGAGNVSPVWQIAIMPRRDQPRYAPNNFLVQWSDDGSAWTTATTINNIDPVQYVNNSTTSSFTTFAVDSSDVAAGPTVGYPLTLINASAELGNLTGWTAISGGAQGILTNPGSSGIDSTPHSGLRSFVATASGSTAAWGQTVDIPAEAWADIDAGMYWANAMCWLKTWSGDDDYGRINVSCLDANGNKLAEGRGQYFAGADTIFWKKVGASCVAPAGTRKLLIWTDSVRTSGTELSVYFDDFELALVYPPDLSPATPHRYWQMVVDANNGDANYITINQMEWLDSTGTPVADGYTSVIAYLNNDYPVRGMATTDTLSCAVSFRGQWWVNYDLGGDRTATISALRVTHRYDGFNAQAQRDFRAQWSDDGVNYYDIAKWERANNWGNSEKRTFPFSTDRYRIRYFLHNGSANDTNGVYFKGVQLRGTVGGADLTTPCEPASGLGGSAFGDGGSTGASIAFDNLVNDNYIGNTSPDRFIEWQFAAPTTIAEVAITARNTVGSQAPNILKVERSTDQGFTYKGIAYIQSGTFTNGQTKAFAFADWSRNITASKLGTYTIEGASPATINAAKVGQYVVEGMVPKQIIVAKMGEYVVEGYQGIGVTKTGMYVVEGPPAPGTFGPFVDTGGHRYWRIFVRRTNNNTQYAVGLNDLELRRNDGRNIVGFGGVGSASNFQSTSSNYGKVANAFDGNTGTLWQTNNAEGTVQANGHGQWLAYDFGDGWTPRIDELVIYPNKDDTNRTPSFFEVQYSDDGASWATDWTVCYRGTYTTNVGVSFARPVFDDPRKARYWALHALSLMNNTAYQNLGGSEFQMMNEEDGTPLTLGKTTGFRSSQSGGENVNSLFDGNNNSIFSTATPAVAGNDYVGFDFGPLLSVEVRAFTWRARSDSTVLFQQSPVAGQMLRSNDGINFVPMWQFSGLTYTNGSTVIVNTPLPVDTLVRGRRRNPNVVVF